MTPAPEAAARPWHTKQENTAPEHCFLLLLSLLFSSPFFLFSKLFLGLTATPVIFGFLRSLLFFHVLVRSAQNLHDSMFSAILRTPVRFFDLNPIGESLTRMLAPVRAGTFFKKCSRRLTQSSAGARVHRGPAVGSSVLKFRH